MFNGYQENNMYFSVIIPLYNKEKYIVRTLDSIAKQSFQNYEVIVVDDGSNDDSALAVQNYKDSRVRLITQQNGGESVARNTGISAAKHENLVFLDADDAWKPDHLATLAELIRDFPSAGIYCTGYEFVEPGGGVNNPQLWNVPQRGTLARYFQSVAKGDQVATASSVCIPAYVFHHLGSFSVGDALGADQDMWARIALHYQVAVDLKSTAIYYRDADNRVCVSEKHVSELPYSMRLQSYLDNAVTLSRSMKRDIEDYIVKGLLTLVSLNVRGGKPDIAQRILRDRRLNKSYRAFFWKILTALPFHASATILKIRSIVHASSR